MGFGLFGTFKNIMGPSAKQSSGLNDLWTAGGTDQSSYSGLDPKALDQWNTLFSGYQQGIAPWQQAGFNQAVAQATNQFSAADAARGGQNPFTIPQIASSAAQYVTPQFAQMNTQALNNLMGMRQISTGSSMSRGPGALYNNQQQADSHWWNMLDNIGSAWGSMGTSGKGCVR